MSMSNEEMHEFANELNERIEKALEENYRKRILVSARNLKNHCDNTDCENCFFFSGDSYCPLESFPACWKLERLTAVEREEYKEND